MNYCQVGNGFNERITSTRNRVLNMEKEYKSKDSLAQGLKASKKHWLEKHWLEYVVKWYPDRRTKTYFSSPLHFNRVPYDVVTLAGQTILMRQPPNTPALKSQVVAGQHVAGSIFTQVSASVEEKRKIMASDVTDDEAVEHVDMCFRALFKKQSEPMLVICGLDFAKYLDSSTGHITSADSAKFPRPATIKDTQDRRGDFDILFVHREFGLIVAELKSVGSSTFENQDLTKSIVTRVKKAVKQMGKAQRVLNHMVSDIVPNVNITKTLVLPNITSSQLKQAISVDTQMQKEFCECLVGSEDVSAAISRCLCKDQMPSLSELQTVSSSSGTETQPLGLPFHLSKLSSWWKQVTMESTGKDAHMDDTIYDQLLARFCGPATTVEVPTVTAQRKIMRTPGQAVAETGLIQSVLILHPEQVTLLNDNSLLCVHLYGPPGTGKTVILTLKACQWLKYGNDVHVLIARKDSRAVSVLIEEQLRHVESLKSGPYIPQVYRHTYDFHKEPDDVSKAVNDLAALAKDGQLCIIADEMLDFFCLTRFLDFCTQLRERVPRLSLWCASLEKMKSPPVWFVEKPLTTSLRTPPVITREVQQSKEIDHHMYILPYTTSRHPSANDGPSIRWLEHEDRPGHVEGEAEDCEGCGKAIAQLLKELDVGRSGPDNLQHRDVMILCENPRDEVKNDKSEVTQPALGMVQALRASQIPVRVLTCHDTESNIRDVALAVKNEVTVSDYETVSGLERRLVVGIGRMSKESECKKSKLRRIDSSRLFAMSRCTGQLIWIGKPSE